MIVIGLTGGIGSGKSTVCERLVGLGAILIDADALVRELQAPGGAVYGLMVERFGAGIVASDGTLDRPAIADIVFNDKAALRDLNGIVHPVVNAEIRAQIRAQAETDELIVLDIPLLVEGLVRDGKVRYVTSGILVVDTPTDVAVARLVEHRGFSEADARARIAAQVTREQRLELADFVVDNSGPADALDAQLVNAWEWARELPSTEPTPEPVD
jgi:dephospho-CoA kinase